MIREVDINEISDGKLYSSNSLVKIGCNDCEGCSECCRETADTILLDPYDIYMLTKGLNTTFAKLLEDEIIELHIVDNVLLPNIRIREYPKGCSFLNESGRCSIHSFRPGFCRLFPLGRIYNETGFDYFIQVNECSHPGKSKVKVKNWLDIPSLTKYEHFILTWHNHLKDFGEEIKRADTNDASKLTVTFLKHYFDKPYDFDRNFYEQFEERFAQLSH